MIGCPPPTEKVQFFAIEEFIFLVYSDSSLYQEAGSLALTVPPVSMAQNVRQVFHQHFLHFFRRLFHYFINISSDKVHFWQPPHWSLAYLYRYIHIPPSLITLVHSKPWFGVGTLDWDLEGSALVLGWGLILLIPVTLQDNVTRLPLPHKRNPYCKSV